MKVWRILFAFACVAPALASRCDRFRKQFICEQATKNGCTWSGGKCVVQSEGTCGQCSQDAQCLVPSRNGGQCQLINKHECQTKSPNNVWCGDSQWIAFSYKINPSKPHFVERYYPLFDLTPDRDMKLNDGGHEAKTSLTTSSSCSETQSKTSASLSVEGNYLAFSGAVSASYDSFHMRKGSHFRADYRIQASLYSVSHSVELDLGAKLDPEVAAFFQDSSPDHIVGTVGEFYASQASLGGIFQMTQIKETVSRKESQDVKSSFSASGSWLVASFKAEGSVGHSSSSKSHSMHQFSQYIALGGDPTVWLALGQSAANLDEIQKTWADSVTPDDLYPTGLTLHPIWELIQHVDTKKAADVKTYLLNKWKLEGGALAAYDSDRFHPNIYQSDQKWAGAGEYGGSCTCPDGEVYQVGDTDGSDCGSMSKSCVGGKPGKCNQYENYAWKNKRVQCGGDRDYDPNTFKTNQNGAGAYGGSCTCPNGQVYYVGDNDGSDCGSMSHTCVGGKPGHCNKWGDVSWSHNKVFCGGPK